MTAYKLIAALILSGSSYTLTAQEQKLLEKERRNIPEPASMPHNQKKIDTTGIRKLSSSEEFVQKGRFSHSTSKGDIYLMPYDNMPCLVPDSKKLAPMPGSKKRGEPKSRMPNITPPYEIPKKKNN